MSNIAIGSRFGKLCVLDAAGKTKWNERTWLCRCDCGLESIVQGKRLRSGGTRSCGCLVKRNGVTHDGRNTRLYRIWRGMIQRCERIKNRDYARYGGAGIRVCTAWRESFSVFRAWAESAGYDDSLFIDRRECVGHYEPTNCRWLTPTKSARNTRAVKLNEAKAEEIRCLIGSGESHGAIAKRFGVSRPLVSMISAGRLWT